ncbi:hypothetical protein TKK_0009912 [Trichogramma kaykai]
MSVIVEKKKCGRKAAVSMEKIEEVLTSNEIEIFDENGQLLKEKNDGWEKAFDLLKPYGETSQHNLYLKLRLKLKTDKKMLERLKPFCTVANPTKKIKMSNDTEQMEEESSNGVISNCDCDHDDMGALHSLKGNVEFYAMIHEMSLSPFHVIYFWPEQVSTIYKNECEAIEVICTELIDVQPFETQFYKSSGILQVSIVGLIDDSCITPLYQVITEQRSNNFINYILCEWFKTGFEPPSELIVPPNVAFIEGAINALNSNYSIQKYIDEIINYVKVNSDLPACHIRANFLPVITYILKYFENDHALIRKLYSKVFILMLITTNIEELWVIIKKTFVVLSTPFKNQEVENSIQSLFNMINDSALVNDIYKLCVCNTSRYDSEIDSMLTKISCTKMEDLINSLMVCESESTVEDSQYLPNSYCNKEFSALFKNVLTFLPFFFMHHKSEYDVRKHSEKLDLKSKYYSLLKDEIDSNALKIQNLSIRVDKFIIHHSNLIKSLSEVCRERLAVTSKSKSSKNYTKRTDVKFNAYSYLNLFENWGGHGEEKQIPNKFQDDASLDLSVLRITELLDKSDKKQKEVVAEDGAENDEDLSMTILQEDYKNTEFDSSKENSVILAGNIISQLDYSIKMINNQVSSPNTDLPKQLTFVSNSVSSINNIKKKDTKFLSNFPEADMYFGNPAQKRNCKHKDIINGNLTGTVKFGKLFYVYENTSALDAVAELFLMTYINFYSFRAPFEKLSDTFVKLIAECHKQGDLKIYYKKRVELLLKVGTVENTTIKIESNLSTLLGKLISDCLSCCVFRIISLENGLTSHFQDEIIATLNQPTQLCSDCQKIEGIKIAYCLAINIENLSNSCCNLDDIPATITLHGKEYILTGNKVSVNVMSCENLSVSVAQNNYSALEDKLNEIFMNCNVELCEFCNNVEAETNYLLDNANYIWVCTEDAYNPAYFVNCQDENLKNLTTDLSVTPVRIRIGQINFDLTGVIQYRPPGDEKGMGHYIAYLRDLSGNWYCANDEDSHIYQNNNEQLPSIKIAAIFYCRSAET